jgi:hypothetical protein
MKMDDAGMGLFEEPKEIPSGVRQVPAHVRMHCEAFAPHLLAEWAQCQKRVDAWIVALLSLQTAHLHDKRLGPANLHGVHYVSDSHTGCLNLREYGEGLSAALQDDAGN